MRMLLTILRLWQLTYVFSLELYSDQNISKTIKIRNSVQSEADARRGRADTSKVHPHVNDEDNRCTETAGEWSGCGMSDKEVRYRKHFFGIWMKGNVPKRSQAQIPFPQY